MTLSNRVTKWAVYRRKFYMAPQSEKFANLLIAHGSLTVNRRRSTAAKGYPSISK